MEDLHPDLLGDALPDPAARLEPIEDLRWVLFDFSGRLGRARWWMFNGVLIALAVAAAAFVSSIPEGPLGAAAALVWFGGVAWMKLALDVKRFHDTGYSGRTVLLSLVLGLGSIAKLFILGFLAGDPRSNEYGPPPAA